MKTILDLIEDKARTEGKLEGKLEGKIEGEIKAIQTVVSLRFQENSRRLTRLLTKLNNLDLLDKTYQFALTASSLVDVENFVEILIPAKSKTRRGARKQTL